MLSKHLVKEATRLTITTPQMTVFHEHNEINANYKKRAVNYRYTQCKRKRVKNKKGFIIKLFTVVDCLRASFSVLSSPLEMIFLKYLNFLKRLYIYKALLLIKTVISICYKNTPLFSNRLNRKI